jgi:hypothetical protein
LPFSLPTWLPWWVPLILLVPAVLYALVFLAAPFNVFGVKSRLDAIEARLDEIQGEIRSLALRLPEPMHPSAYDDTDYAPLAPRRGTRPPIPPADRREPRLGPPR